MQLDGPRYRSRVFTGIIESVGSVTAVTGDADGKLFTITSDVITEDLKLGDSVCINGVCLTAVRIDAGEFDVEVVIESLDRTNLGALTPGGQVNLERAMPVSGRFDGHVVQGHVDGTGTLEAIEAEGEGRRWTITARPGLLKYIVEKGSITVNGVSLTVAALGEGAFQIALIPHTLGVTTFGSAGVGDSVNLEVDILAKYVERLMESRL